MTVMIPQSVETTTEIITHEETLQEDQEVEILVVMGMEEMAVMVMIQVGGGQPAETVLEDATMVMSSQPEDGEMKEQ